MCGLPPTGSREPAHIRVPPFHPPLCRAARTPTETAGGGGGAVAVAPRQTRYGRRKHQRPASSAAAAAATTSACVRDGSSFHSASQRAETQGASKIRLTLLR